ncbi:MAG: L-arabinose isomerase [Treponema sp.]|nr:L-arabinose isomerase [Treponema sp.]
MILKDYEFWFVTGSQDLYGEETLRQVAKDSKEIVESLNKSGSLPCPLVWKPTLLTPASIRETLEQANADGKCAGIICWMHTFSPAKMWIAGLNAYKKPLLQLNTQFNEKIPYSTMDMDFMNLNQSAHGDREFGYITARMDIPRKVICGHWQHEDTQKRIADWMRVARAVADGKTLRVIRFGDNMREVAVTDGDKVAAMVKFGWSVPYYGIGDLVACMNEVKQADIDALYDEYNQKYEIVYDCGNGFDKDFVIGQIKEQAKIEIALRAFLKDNDGSALCTNFQDLHGMKQLPGLAIQRLLADGYGFGAEGDWKTSALVRTFKVMTAGQVVAGKKGNAFMEDYTYNLVPGKEANMGSHMLEVDPEIAVSKPKIEVHHLGIGDREPPARMVFNTLEGAGLVAAVVQMGGRFRCVVNEIDVIPPEAPLPKLPVARMLWKPRPSLATSAESWILAGGGHHTAFSNIISADMLRDWAEMVGIECVVIDADTKVHQFRNELRWNEAYWNGRR